MSSGSRSGGFHAGGNTRERGTSAERDGARWLEAHGYTIVATNVAYRFGEIDLVAIDGGTLCFVEIKARRTTRRGTPAEAVTPAKQRRLTRCARAYLRDHPHSGPCRFDVLAMLADGDGWRVELIRDAFLAAG